MQKKVAYAHILLLVSIFIISYIVSMSYFFVNTAIELKPYQINLELYNPQFQTISAEPDNTILLKFSVLSKDGLPVNRVRVRFNIPEGYGKVYPEEAYSSSTKDTYIAYIPKALPKYMKITIQDQLNEINRVSISATIPCSDINATVSFKLVKPPIVLVHGYLENLSYLYNLKNFILDNGIDTRIFEYDSTLGIEVSAQLLATYLEELRFEYMSQGILVNKFDVIAHSMGGVVVRFYSTSDAYLKHRDIRKIIFISVPHKGSPWASLGVNYYQDKGIFDLQPSSPIYTELLPKMINQGLNNTIQTANIVAEHDELVTLESVSLEEWNINTEVFNVGKNNLDKNMLVSGEIKLDLNHKKILNNSKVFDRIIELLNIEMTKPQKK